MAKAKLRSSLPVFRLYEKFRPEVAPGNEGWGAKVGLEIEKILTAA